MERIFGPKLDALDSRQRDELAAAVLSPHCLRIYVKHPRSLLVRPALLAELKRRARNENEAALPATAERKRTWGQRSSSDSSGSNSAGGS